MRPRGAHLSKPRLCLCKTSFVFGIFRAGLWQEPDRTPQPSPPLSLPGTASLPPPAEGERAEDCSLLPFLMLQFSPTGEPAQMLGENIWDHFKPFFENGVVAALGLENCNLPHRCWKQRMWLCFPEMMHSREEGRQPGSPPALDRGDVTAWVLLSPNFPFLL